MEVAKQAEEKGFWLPPEFLDDDMFLAGEEEDVQPASLDCRNSPSFLFDDERNQSPAFSAARSNHKSLVGSPQSTLCRTASPPSTPSTQSAAEDDDALEVLYAAAREITAMIKLQEHQQQLHQKLLLQQLLHQQQQEQFCGGGFLSPAPANLAAAAQHFPPASFAARHAPTLHEIQLLRLRQQELLIKQQLSAMAWANGQNRERAAAAAAVAVAAAGGFNGYPLLHHQYQHHHQHRIGSGGGMRAIFLNSSGKESAGTGVFLPKRAGNGAPSDQTRKKSGCSTVLVPARVMQALNLDIEKLAVTGAAHPRYPAGYVIDHGSPILSLRGQKIGGGGAAVAGEEVGLPPEWTY